MKLLISIPAILLLLSCSSQDQSTGDTTETRDAISAVLNNYHKGILDKNLDLLLSTIANDGIVLGTDPNEYLSKREFAEYLSAPFSTDELYAPYSVEREIRFTPDGNSAVAIEQYTFTVLSPVPVRGIAHMVHKNGEWLINMYSLSLVPTNADLVKINELLRNQ